MKTVPINTDAKVGKVKPNNTTLTKTKIGNHLRRHALGDQPTFRQGFYEGVAFAKTFNAAMKEST